MNQRPFDDAMIDRCCLYLLGEMPAAEADDFQRECAASVELQTCLAEQAELISQLGLALADPQFSGTESRFAAAALPQPLSQTERESVEGWGLRRWLSSRGAIAAAVALAASLLLWVGLPRNAEFVGEESPETLQLAHAWATGRGEVETAEDWASDSLIGESLRNEPWEVAELVAQEDAGASDSTAEEMPGESGPPQWLIVAVRALEAEATPTAEAPTPAEPSAEATEVSDE